MLVAMNFPSKTCQSLLGSIFGNGLMFTNYLGDGQDNVYTFWNCIDDTGQLYKERYEQNDANM